MKKTITFVSLTLASLSTFAAEPCLDNFTSAGSFLTGQTYKTSGVLNGINPQDAFARAYAFTSENGFTVTSSNKEAGVISAAQTATVGTNRAVPLTISLQPDVAGTRAMITYTTHAGQTSPQDAIKKHFCATFAAASDASRSNSASPATSQQGAQRPETSTNPRGYAAISPEQQAALAKELPKTLPSPQIKALVAEAAPTITRFIERLACLADVLSGAGALNEFAAPGTTLSSYYVSLRPMRETPYHNKATCLTVIRVQGWRAPANNALQFEVVYKAEDSGEAAKTAHELVRQPDGAWLFTR